MAGSLQILGELFRNLGLLAILAVSQVVVGQYAPQRLRQVLSGILFGGGAIAAMATTIQITPGHLLDVRNVMTALAGPFGGSVGALLTVSIAAVYRIYLGDVGVLRGIVGLTSVTAIGLAFRIAMPRLEYWRWRNFAALGVTASCAVLATFFLLDGWEAVPILGVVGLPLTAVTVLGVVLLGGLLRESEQRRLLLHSLSATAERFSTVFHSAFNYLLLLDRFGRVVQANETALRVAGFPQQDLGRELWASSWWADHQCKDELRDLVMRAVNGEVVRGQAGIRACGQRLDISLKPWAAIEGCEQYLLFEGRDITELMEQQEQLRQSERLRALGQLSSGIAHEFNNLLLLISANADLMLHNLPSGEGRDAALKLAQAARNARDLTHRLLSFGRRQQLTARIVDVNEVARSTIELAKTLLPETLKLDLRSESPIVQAGVDSHQLELALVNLILNARDAMSAQGCVSIEVSEEIVNQEEAQRLGIEPGAYASLIISDNGAGMNPETAARAFEPFFTTKPIGQGTGLGLSMVHGFVLQSGGHISLETEPGVGTAIRLLLPAELRHAKILRARDNSVWPQRIRA